MSETEIDPEWARLRGHFDALLDVPAAERDAAFARLELSESVRHKLERLLAAELCPEPFLEPGQPIVLAPDDDDVAPPSAPALPRRLGRYELRAHLGRGGMGEVFRAHDGTLDRDVALKILADHLLADPQWLPRFRSEARTAGALNHPNVITVHDVGEEAGEHFLVTEFVDGQTLRQRLAAGPLPWPELLDIGAQVAGAVAAAHAAGVVHRDLKPENVMLRPDGLVKVLDFGLAKAMRGPVALAPGQSTQVGVLLGTMRYMAPEQARGGEVDARADVFALGALLYEMATGRPAFDGATALDVLVALLEREPPSVRERRPELPDEFAALVQQALQKDRALRLSSAAAVAARLDALRAEPVAAPVADEPPVPEVRYAQSGDVNIAYQVLGSGPLDLVFVMGWISHLEWFWREPSFARFLRRLASFARVILFDKRGTGLSDRVANDRLPTLEQRMDDVRVVLDAIGSESAVLCGISEGGPMCALFAATRPQRTRGLVMIGSYARRLRADGYPWGSTIEARERFCDDILRNWGGPVGIAERAPSLAGDKPFRDWWAAYLRHGASPSAAVALTRMNAEIDIRPVLPTIRVPTLVVHRTGDRCLRIEEGRYLASLIPQARLVELPGDDHLPFVGDQDAVLRAIEDFCAALPGPSACDRALAAVLAVQCAGVAGGAGGAGGGSGDGASLRTAALRETAIADGRTLHIGGGRLLATFDGPARAVHLARQLLALATRLQTPAGIVVHVGECEVRGGGAVGPAVDDALALLRDALPGAVVVTAPVRDLVAGAGFAFAPIPPADGGVGRFVLEA